MLFDYIFVVTFTASYRKPSWRELPEKFCAYFCPSVSPGQELLDLRIYCHGHSVLELGGHFSFNA